MVRAMRTPSSSSSEQAEFIKLKCGKQTTRRTDGHWLDPDGLLEMSGLGMVRHLVGKDFGFAKGVHKCRAASSRRTWREGKKILDGNVA